MVHPTPQITVPLEKGEIRQGLTLSIINPTGVWRNNVTNSIRLEAEVLAQLLNNCQQVIVFYLSEPLFS